MGPHLIHQPMPSPHATVTEAGIQTAETQRRIRRPL